MIKIDLFLVFAYSYFLGSIPFGLIITKFFLGKDIRNIGSGNIGATNVLRGGNKVIGYATLILDISKAILPVIFVKFNYPNLIYIASLCAFLGHLFPIWLKFKGGKGVATYVGILFSINFIFGIIFGLVWIITFFISKYSSLSSILGTLSVPIYIFYVNGNNTIFFIIMFVLIFYTHRENIKRLINKQETKTKIY